jgi:hypothetical protein
MFSNLLDITGFFVSVLINLLLVALICYYFKRKIDNLEYSQSEQAKTLYTLISQQNMLMNNENKNVVIRGSDVDVMDGLDLTQLNQPSDEESASESEDESEDDNEEVDEVAVEEDCQIDEEEVKQIEFDNSGDYEQDDSEIRSQGDITVVHDVEEFAMEEMQEELDAEEEVAEEVAEEDAEVAEVVPEEVVAEEEVENYEKMTVKELKNVLAEKGVHAKSSMNKGDIINILKGTANTMEIDETIEEM